MSWSDGRHSALSCDDASLIARVLNGERQQFAPLVERYQAALHRYAVSMVLDHDVAADMVQDAFVRAYTNLAACRDRTRFRAWLFQTLRNRCLDHLKDARRRNIPLEAAGSFIDPAEGPGARVERVRVRAELRQALARLPDVLREAFLLRYVEGASYDTMAELLHASVSALKMRVLRARAALAADLLNRDVTETAPARLSVRRETGETS
ncbi:MAG: RNA polymerase sigma factor [Acidobacteria bacterium]|nr:RNA polymerase sigma factor [Acidobacteriota bacterium]